MSSQHGWAMRTPEQEKRLKVAQSKRRYWLAVVIVAAISIGAFSAQLFWPFLLPHLLSAANETTSRPKSSLKRVSGGPSISPTPPVDTKLVSLGTDDVGAKSPRMLHLVETLPGKNIRDGRARIGTDPRNPQTYSTGSIMLNGAQLTEIYSDHVVLERSSEKVELYIDSKGQKPDRAMSADLLMVGGLPPAAWEDQTSARPNQPRNLVLTDFVRPNPVFEGGHLQGVELFSGERAEVFTRLGLTDGDVVTAVNGAAVTDAGDVVNQLEQLLAGGALDVTVKRGAQMVQLNLSGSVLASESFGDTAFPGIGREPGT